MDGGGRGVVEGQLLTLLGPELSLSPPRQTDHFFEKTVLRSWGSGNQFSYRCEGKP